MKSKDQRVHWDLKYEQGLPSLEKPDPFFVSAFEEFVEGQFPDGGAALDLAGGIGRHALWLAKQKWAVTVVDISEVAIRKLGEKAREIDVGLNLFALDAQTYPFEADKFDLIVVFYHFDRDICAKLLSALRPGGFVVCKSSLIWGSYEGPEPANLRPLRRQEILTLFPALRTDFHQERPVRDRGVVEYVGMKQAGNGAAASSVDSGKFPKVDVH